MEMKKTYLLLAVLLLLMMPHEGLAKSYYNSASNNFGGLFPHPGMMMKGRYKAIEEGRLVEENASMARAISIDTMTIWSMSYRYQLRLANLNNKQGKTLSIKDPMTGHNTRLTNTQWGLVFNYDQGGNYYAVLLSCDNSSPYDDITDKRSMQVSITQNRNGNAVEIAKTTIVKGISLEDDMNTLCVDVDDHSIIVSIGKNELQQVLEASVTRPTGAVHAGYLVGPGARVAIERAVLTIDNEKQIATTTAWTRDALDQHFQDSIDPVEGYWTYLDRDMDDTWLRLGGRYTLAVVSSDSGYDIIYIDGAQVKKSQWHSCMLKGHMTQTIFSGNYDLSWIDATMEPIGIDNYATVENGVVLTLHFPEYKSQVRFAKVLAAGDD